MRQVRVFAAVCGVLAGAGVAAADAPNVLLLVADDLGWNGVGFHQPDAPTPNLNRLAEEGTELRRFYTYPVCSPTRAALLTGRLPRRFGVVDALGPWEDGLPDGLPSLPGAFRAAGYATSLIGKWHLGEAHPPRQRGFDHFYGFLGPQLDYFAHTNPRGVVDWQRDGTNLEERGYATYLFADEAIRQLNQRDPAQPFFLEVAFNAPHVPLAAPEELVAKHQARGGDAAIYAAMLEALDAAVGRILAALDEAGLRERTLVVFFSDNGGARRFTDSTPLSGGKDTINEGGIRTPCVVRWPGRIAAGAVLQQPVSVQDLYPTLAAAAGVTVPPDAALDGVDQWPALRSGKPVAREPVFIASRDLALIDGDWKLIEWSEGRRALYNVASDPGEAHDELANEPERAQRLGRRLDELKRGLPPAGERKPRPPPGGHR